MVRTVSLPREIDADKAEASFEHGVLTLRLPKAEEAKPRQIPIGGRQVQIGSGSGTSTHQS